MGFSSQWYPITTASPVSENSKMLYFKQSWSHAKNKSMCQPQRRTNFSEVCSKPPLSSFWRHSNVMHQWQTHYMQSNLNAHSNLLRLNCNRNKLGGLLVRQELCPRLARHGQCLGHFCMVQSRAIWFDGCPAQRPPWGVHTACPGHGTEEMWGTLHQSAQARLSWWAQGCCCCQIWAGSCGPEVLEPCWTQADLIQSHELSLRWFHQHIQSYLYHLDLSDRAPSPH